MKTIYYNGKINTLDKNNNIYNTLVLNNEGKIEALGDDINFDSVDNELIQKINLNNKIIYPGFIDSHLHMLNYALIENNLKLYECKSLEEIKEQINKIKIQKNKNEWIIGRGWNEEKFIDKKFKLDKKFLDEISEDVPIFLIRACGHLAVGNTKVMEEIKKTKNYSKFLKYINFEKGILLEGAVKLSYDAIPAYKSEKIKELIKIASKKLNECGITSVHSDNFLSLPGKDYKEIINAFVELEKNKELTVKVCDQASFTNKEDLEIFLNDKEYSNVNGEFYKIGPIKIYQDGSLGAKTALLKENYEGEKDNAGVAIHSMEDLEKMIKLAHNAQKSAIVHTIGDLALEQVVNIVEKIQKNSGITNLRHGVVHVQIASNELLEKIKENKMIAYIQPVFTASDMDIVEKLIGKKRTNQSYAWKTMQELGIVLAGGSDSPVESFDILENIQIGVTRKKLTELDKKPWREEEKLSIKNSIEMFTKNGAYAAFEENIKGTLEVGKVGDLVILDKDIEDVSENEIKNIKIMATILNGKIVYKSDEWEA